MRYCPAGDLMRVLDLTGTFQEEEAKHYILSIAKGLEAIHSQGILYRDLKVYNFIRGQVFIVSSLRIYY